MRFLFILFILSCSKSDLVSVTFEFDTSINKEKNELVLTHQSDNDTLNILLNKQNEYSVTIKPGLWSVKIIEQQKIFDETIIDLTLASRSYSFQIDKFENRYTIKRKTIETVLVTDKLSRIYEMTIDGENLEYITTGGDVVRVNSDIIAYKDYSQKNIELYSKSIKRTIQYIPIPLKYRHAFLILDYISGQELFLISTKIVNNNYIITLDHNGNAKVIVQGHSAKYSKYDKNIYYLNDAREIYHSTDQKSKICKLGHVHGDFSFNSTGEKIITNHNEKGINTFSIINLENELETDIKFDDQLNFRSLNQGSNAYINYPSFTSVDTYIFFNNISENGRLIALYRMDIDGSNIIQLLKGDYRVRSSW